ncbi:hypothetical protein J588_2758 [Acinetobacter sp. 1578804]|nr:hypothetical protein J588_2758 [Acinetobacter sp. 1578804]
MNHAPFNTMNCYHVKGAFFMSGKKNQLVEKGVFRSFYGFAIKW